MTLQLTLQDWSQRWLQQQAHWVPRKHVCDVSTLDAVPLDKDAVAKRFVVEHHYSGSYTAASERIALYERGTLAGVAVFGAPAGPTALARQLAAPGAELQRFVLLDSVAFNAETWFLARCFELLRQRRPEWRAILAYSDPVPRRDASGAVVLPGHWGQIYQAHNAAYRGRATPRTLYLDARGCVVSERAISKLRRGDQGHAYARELVLASGAPEQLPGEPVDAWLKRCRETWRRVRHPGNHVYVWSLGPLRGQHGQRGAHRLKYKDTAPRPKAIDAPL